MLHDPIFWMLAVPAIIFSGISKAGFGSGVAFAGPAFLAIVLDPAQALGLVLPLFMLIDLVSLKPYWRKWDWRACRYVILGGLPGVALGVWLFQVANADVFRVLMGVLAILFVAWQALRQTGVLTYTPKKPGRVFGVIMGTIGGFTSFVSHSGGPPVAMYLLGSGVSKLTYQASSVLIFWVINIFKFVPYAYLGIFTWETLLADAILAPAAILGAWIGIKLHHKVPEVPFFVLTYIFLLATGGKLLWDGLT